MSVNFDGMIGPSYQLTNQYAAIQRLVNWMLIPNEAPEEKGWSYVANPCPGNKAFCALPVPAAFSQPSRGLLELRGRCFGVNGNAVFEIDSTGAFISIGTVSDDGKPACMVANGTGQIFIASGGNGYVIPAGAGAGSLITVGGGFLGASYATFQDGYILVVTPNSNQIQISGDDSTPLGDATIWSAGNVSVQAGQADYLRAILSSREYVRLFGYRRSQVYQDVGNNGIGGFPFQSYNQTFIETGCAAAFSVQDLGDALIWIGEDARGQRACWMDKAFSPQRVSTFAVELWWQKYTTVENAISMSFIWQGHLIYAVTFPTAGLTAGGDVVSATWWLDVTATQLAGRPIWTERSYLAPGGGLQDAVSIAPGRAEVTHAYCFGRHLVGSNGTDGNPGAIYEMSADTYTDCGADPFTLEQILQPVICDRITPHLTADNKRIVYNRIEFNLARGVGQRTAAVNFTGDLTDTSADIAVADTTGLYVGELVTGSDFIPENSLISAIVPNTTVTISPAAATGTESGVTLQACLPAGLDPQLLLRWSNDGGKTFGEEYQLSMGRQGDYSIWVYLNQLGYATHGGRVFWIRCADPVFNSLASASLDLFRSGS